MDENPIITQKRGYSSKSRLKKGSSNIFSTPRLPTHKAVKPVLDVILKLEVANAPAPNRQRILEAAYVLEEILQAVENGHKKLPEQVMQMGLPKIMNRVLEGKIAKEEEERAKKMSDKQRLDFRKQLLRNQLEKMKVDKDKKIIEDKEVKKKDDEKTKRQQLRIIEANTK